MWKSKSSSIDFSLLTWLFNLFFIIPVQFKSVDLAIMWVYFSALFCAASFGEYLLQLSWEHDKSAISKIAC